MKNLISILVATLVAWSVAVAVSQGGAEAGGIPVVAICATLAFAINWVAFVPSWLAQTERYYDIIGSLTYISTTLIAVLLVDDLDARAIIAAAMVVVWAGRLGTFLFRRILRDGGDSRFDKIKQDPSRLFLTWTLQALWVTFTAASAWSIITAVDRVGIGAWAIVGIAVWLIGFGFEVVADQQKSAFKTDPANEGRFIDVGLWSISRHPNYFGEIVLWTGIAIMAVPVLEGWRWVALISPVFVTVLLTRISGIPMLERTADKRWGDQPDYQDYKRNTPILVPFVG